jgi:release factor glutamine methyltransferase
MRTTVGQALREGEQILSSNRITHPRNDALLLLAAITNQRKEILLAYPERFLSESELTTYREWLVERARDYPLQYLTGQQEFFGRSFLVSPAVLIPRPETEIIVQACLDVLSLKKPGSVLDIGCGSGCIAITLLCEIPALEVTGTDISSEALKVAEENSRRHHCSNRLQLLQGSATDPIAHGKARFDLIVSNPPYVAHTDSVDPAVRFEPKQAVFADQSGLSVYEQILAGAAPVLKPEGHLVLETAFERANEVARMAEQNSWREIERRQDLAGIDRCLVLQPA